MRLKRAGAGGIQLEGERLAERVIEFDGQGVEAAIGRQGGGGHAGRKARDGLARGVKLLNEARTTATDLGHSPVKPVQVGLDVFHTEREMQRVVSRLWAGAAKL